VETGRKNIGKKFIWKVNEVIMWFIILFFMLKDPIIQIFIDSTYNKTMGRFKWHPTNLK
jgi:hypothetical protein